MYTAAAAAVASCCLPATSACWDETFVAQAPRFSPRALAQEPTGPHKSSKTGTCSRVRSRLCVVVAQLDRGLLCCDRKNIAERKRRDRGCKPVDSPCVMYYGCIQSRITSRDNRRPQSQRRSVAANRNAAREHGLESRRTISEPAFAPDGDRRGRAAGELPARGRKT